MEKENPLDELLDRAYGLDGLLGVMDILESFEDNLYEKVLVSETW